MKDKNGIEICCENCRHYEYCDDKFFPDVVEGGEGCNFEVSANAYEACIEELQNSLDETEKKLTETVKLLSERSRECGELEAYNEVLQKRVQEFSMELLEYNMKENRDVLERLKQAESEKD